jgi:hypothetical protein
LGPTRHPKWQEVNLGANLPGWKRFPASQQWLERHSADIATGSAKRDDFQSFLNERQPPGNTDRDRLFEEFVKWRGARR